MIRKIIFAISLLALIGALTAYLLPTASSPLLPYLDGKHPEQAPDEARFGLINTDGRVVHRASYSNMEADPDNCELIGVMTGGGNSENWSLVNLLNGRIYPEVWDSISLHQEGSLATVGQGEYYYLIDRDGHKVGPRLEPGQRLHPPDGDFFPVQSSSGKWGWVDNKGNVVLSDKGDLALPSSEVYTPSINWDGIGDFDEHGMAPVLRGELWGWINLDGTLIEPRWKVVNNFDNAGMAMVEDASSELGWVDLRGDVVIPTDWDVALPFDEADMAAVQKSNRWGWIDRSGETVIPLKYLKFKTSKLRDSASISSDWVLSFDNRFFSHPFDAGDIAIVQSAENNKWGAIYRTGEIAIPFDWDDMGQFWEDGLAPVMSGEKWGLIDTKGEVVIEPQWDNFAGVDDDGLIRVEVDGKWGWVNKSGEPILEPAWSYIEPFDKNGFAVVQTVEGGGSEIIDHEGRTISPGMEGGWEELGPFNIGESYYFCLGFSKPGFIRKWMKKIEGWFSGEDAELDSRELVMLWLSPKGEVIWDNRKVTFEARCWLVFGLALLVAVLSRPKKNNQTQT